MTGEELLALLPPEDVAEMELQSRAVLRVLFVGPVGQLLQVAPVPSQCPNCEAVVLSTRTPYCCESCKEEASFVRQFRTGLKSGWLDDPEKQSALGQALWHLLGGGRPLRVHIIPERSKVQALKRTEGKCQTCGVPATTFDHIATGCNRPINLRPVCQSCQQTRPFGDRQIISQSTKRIDDLAGRIWNTQPVRICDDAEGWDWRDYLRARPKAP
jgi:hypothetical protein